MAKLFGLNARNLQRVRRAVAKSEAERRDTRGSDTGGSDPSPKFYIKLIDESDSWYSWKKVYWGGDDWADYDPAIDSAGEFTARDLNATTGLEANTVVEVKFQGLRDDDETPVYLFIVGSTSSSGGMQFKTTSPGHDEVSAVTWDGTTAGGTSYTIICAQGHDVGDVIYAVELLNVPATGDLNKWVEIITFDTDVEVRKVLQIVDSFGHIAADWVRAH